MGIDIAALDSLKQRFIQDPDGKWYARSYLGSVLAAEDEIIGYSAGPVPGEIQDVFNRQRLAIIAGPSSAAAVAGDIRAIAADQDTVQVYDFDALVATNLGA